MKQVMRVFASTRISNHPIRRIQDRDRFFAALSAEFRDRCTVRDGYVQIEYASREDLMKVRETSGRCGIEFSYAVEDEMSASDYRRASFVRLGIDGEPVDEDEDGGALNQYPELVCPHCSMPEELVLPEHYVVSKRRVVDRIGGWGEAPPSPGREIYSGCMGVLIVGARLKEILESVVGGQLKYSPVVFDDVELVTGDRIWAARPVVNWGSRLGRNERARCSCCSRATAARLSTEGFTPFDDARHTLAAGKLPDAEIVCAEGWFGNRLETPFGYWRDVYVSGRLYALLRELRVRGISSPADVVWVDDDLPMKDAKEVSEWSREHHRRLLGTSVRVPNASVPL